MPARASTALRHQAFLALHSAGWPDTPIASVMHAAISTVKEWRERNGLPKNPTRCIKIDDVEARRMHAAGASDHEIGRRFGMLQCGVTRWRQRNGLPPNIRMRRCLTDEEKRRARKLLRQGASARQVADQLGDVGKNAVLHLRKKMKHPLLRPHGVTNEAIRRRVLDDPTITPRIERAIGRGLPLEVRLEAVSEMYLAVLDGRLDVSLIEAEAGAFRSRAFDICGGSKYGPRSLDEELGEDWTLLDTIDDPDALEDMERAAERVFDDN